MSPPQDHRSTSFSIFYLFPLIVILSSFSGVRAAFAQDPFIDEFDGPDLTEGWSFREESGPEAQVGFTEDGRYQINEPTTSAEGHTGLLRPITGIESFTVDFDLHFEDFSGANTDFKFRLFGGQFIELVYNSFDDIRVFSAEQGGNVNRINGVGISDNVPLRLRFIWNRETGNATFGLSIDGAEMQEIATAEGLLNFTPNSIDVVMFKFGEGNGNTPKMFLDRFEIRLGVFPLNEVEDDPEPRISSIEVSDDGATRNVTVTWSSVPDEFYLVEQSEDLIEWEELDDTHPSGGSTTSYEIELPDPAPPKLYFRVGKLGG